MKLASIFLLGGLLGYLGAIINFSRNFDKDYPFDLEDDNG